MAGTGVFALWLSTVPSFAEIKLIFETPDPEPNEALVSVLASEMNFKAAITASMLEDSRLAGAKPERLCTKS